MPGNGQLFASYRTSLIGRAHPCILGMLRPSEVRLARLPITMLGLFGVSAGADLSRQASQPVLDGQHQRQWQIGAGEVPSPGHEYGQHECAECDLSHPTTEPAAKRWLGVDRGVRRRASFCRASGRQAGHGRKLGRPFGGDHGRGAVDRMGRRGRRLAQTRVRGTWLRGTYVRERLDSLSVCCPFQFAPWLTRNGGECSESMFDIQHTTFNVRSRQKRQGETTRSGRLGETSLPTTGD